MSDQQDNEGSGAAALRTPPYVAYKTFLTLIEELKTNSVPPQMDRSVLKRFSGGVGAQLLMSLRSLGLINEQNQPTNRLEVLVRTFGTNDFKMYMKEALRFGYPFLAKLDLMTATPSMFAEAFKSTGAKEDVLKKCRRFFLQAAKEVELPLGPRLLAASAGSGGSSSSSARPAGSGSPAAATPVRKRATPRQRTRESNDGDGGTPSQTIKQQLVGKYPDFDPKWPEPIQKAWFDGFAKLMATAEAKENGGQ